MKKAVFVFTAPSYHVEAAPVVAHFVAKAWSVRVIIGWCGPSAEDLRGYYEKMGCLVLIPPEHIGYGHPSHVTASQRATSKDTDLNSNRADPPKAELKARLKRWVKFADSSFHVLRLGLLPIRVLEMRRRRQYVHSLFDQWRPDVVFDGSFYSVGQLDNAVASACRRFDILYCCLPNTSYLGTTNLTAGRLVHLTDGMASDAIRAEYDWINILIARNRPNWTRRLSDGSVVFYQDPLEIVSSEISGLPMRSLWIKPSIDFDLVFAHTEYSQQLLAESGYPLEKVVVSGQPTLDRVMANLNDRAHLERLFAHIKLVPGTPFLLYNVEPSAEHSYCSWDKHWENFHAMMGCATSLGMPVVLSLHPLCRLETYRFAESQYNVVISTEFSIHELYPHCALSFSFACSTNMLAERFGKPLVIYELFGSAQRDPDWVRLNVPRNAFMGHTPEDIYSLLHDPKVKSGSATEVRTPLKSACDTIYDMVDSVVRTRQGSPPSADPASVADKA